MLLAALVAMYQYLVTDVNFMDINLFSSGKTFECRAIYFSSIIMYKVSMEDLVLPFAAGSRPDTILTLYLAPSSQPLTLPLWYVLMATTHSCYWRRVKSTPLKDQTNVDPGGEKARGAERSEEL